MFFLMFVFSFVFPFCLFSSTFSSLFHIFDRPTGRKNRQEIPSVKMTISVVKIRFLGLDGQGRTERGEGVRNGPLDGDSAFTFLSCFPFSFFFSNVFHCKDWYQRLTRDVSSVVGAPWRCGVLTT